MKLQLADKTMIEHTMHGTRTVQIASFHMGWYRGPDGVKEIKDLTRDLERARKGRRHVYLYDEKAHTLLSGFAYGDRWYCWWRPDDMTWHTTARAALAEPAALKTKKQLKRERKTLAAKTRGVIGDLVIPPIADEDHARDLAKVECDDCELKVPAIDAYRNEDGQDFCRSCAQRYLSAEEAESVPISWVTYLVTCDKQGNYCLQFYRLVGRQLAMAMEHNMVKLIYCAGNAELAIKITPDEGGRPPAKMADRSRRRRFDKLLVAKAWAQDVAAEYIVGVKRLAEFRAACAKDREANHDKTQIKISADGQVELTGKQVDQVITDTHKWMGIPTDQAADDDEDELESLGGGYEDEG